MIKDRKICTACEDCFTCEKCYTEEGGCDNCYSCENCYTDESSGSQKDTVGCNNCYTCEKCYTEEGSCDSCYSCEKCYTEEGGCNECYTCEKCYTDESDKKTRTSPAVTPGMNITYFFFPTNQCNLRCDYCYATKRNVTMDKRVADRALDFITIDEEKRAPNRRINIQFFGGEPTVEFDLLKYIVERGNKLAQERLGKKINWGMTTNGTLLDEERIKWLKSVGIKPLISIDGKKETHDKHRIYADGRGSFDDIPLELYLKYFPNTEIRPTILPDTIETWADDLRWFQSKGCYTVATEVAYEADWTPEAMAKAWKMYNELADIYIDLKRQGKKVWMKFIDDGRKTLGIREQRGYVCGIGKNTLAIDGEGDIYSCQRYASFADKSLALGNIWDGFDPIKLTEANSLKRELMRPAEGSLFDCETCPARYRCRGGCNAMNYQVNGDRKIIMDNNCKFQRLWTTISLRALAATGELWDRFKVQKASNAQSKPSKQVAKTPSMKIPRKC